MEPDRQLIETVRARVPLAEVVSRYVALRSQGNNLIGKCPFHEEKTPSFTVSPHNGMFYCFGCEAGGDVFTFLMRMEKLSFPEALAQLAAQAGVSLPGPATRAGSPEERLLRVNEQVTRHFERNLASPQGRSARAYLEGRGIDLATAKRFRLGYALPGWQDLLEKFGSHVRELEALGLIVKSARGRRYDRFRDRLVFPLCDAQGRVRGFAGRRLSPDEKVPKYVNTPNTPLLKKGTLLYAWHLAQGPARRLGSLVLVEGYTDVIAAHRHGIEHVVASMGTALTAPQARLCARAAPRIVLAFDRDHAGQAATLRGIQALLAEGLEVLMVEIPENTDPDAFIRERGAAAFTAALQNARPFFEMYVDALCRQHGAHTFAGKQRTLSEALAFLRGVDNLHWRGHLIAELASALDLPDEEIERALRRRARSAPARSPARDEGRRWGPQEHVLYFLLHGQLSVERATAELEDEDFGRYRALWETIKTEHARQGTVRLEALYDALDAEGKRTLSRLGVSQLRFADAGRAVEDALRKLKLTRLERTIRALRRAQKRAESAGDHRRAKELLARYAAAIKSREVLIHGKGEGPIHDRVEREAHRPSRRA